jgi:hypothetical protein
MGDHIEIRHRSKLDYQYSTDVERGRHTFFSPSGPIVEMNAIGLGVFSSVLPSSRYGILTMAEIMNYFISFLHHHEGEVSWD